MVKQYINKIFYINLKKRVDRQEQIELELDNFNLEYERFEAIETPGFGILGCGLSHLSVLKLAKERNYGNILILEDDFTFLVSKEEFERNIVEFFELNIDYDVCMLSYAMNKHETTSYNIINKVLDAQTASGYIVHKKYYDKLIDLYENAMPLLKETKQHLIYSNDQIWKKLQPIDNWYYFTTRIGKQRAGYSDNLESFQDYNA